MLALAVMAMGFLTTFTQANFVDFIVSGYMLLIIYTTINSNLLGYLNQFFGIAVIAFCYDLIWVLFASTVKFIFNYLIIDWF